MFADPQSITVGEDDISLPAISREKMRSLYRSADGEYELLISHQEGSSRDRRTVRVNRTITAPDPFQPDNNVTASVSYYLVIDNPLAGFSIADMGADVAALVAWLTSNNVAKVLGGES